MADDALGLPSLLKNPLTSLDSPMATDWWVMASPSTPGNSHHAFRCKGEYLTADNGFADYEKQLLTVRYKNTDRASVDAFYNAAIEAGAKDNGKPGLRPHYHAHYYGAFVLVSDFAASSHAAFADLAILTGSCWK